jgi:periplasmic protein TonB
MGKKGLGPLLVLGLLLAACATGGMSARTARTKGQPEPADAVRAGAASEADQPPRPVYIVRPEYPPDAVRVEATVSLKVVINEEGRVVGWHVLTPRSALDEAAIACVRQWRFKPAMHDGKPVATPAILPVEFKPGW